MANNTLQSKYIIFFIILRILISITNSLFYFLFRTEENRRFQIFAENVNKISKHNEEDHSHKKGSFSIKSI